MDALARKEAALEERRNMLDGASVKREELAGLWAELKDMKLFNHKVLSMLQKSVGEEHPRKRQKGEDRAFIWAGADDNAQGVT